MEQTGSDAFWAFVGLERPEGRSGPEGPADGLQQLREWLRLLSFPLPMPSPSISILRIDFPDFAFRNVETVNRVRA
jgi:hypothetical protein